METATLEQVEIKPGYLTSEFLGKCIIQGIALLVLFGVITTSDQAHAQDIALTVIAALESAYAFARGIAKKQPHNIITPVATIAPLMLACFAFAGCATDTGDAAADRRGRVTNAVLENVAKAVGRVAVSTLTNAATQQLNGGKVDLAQSASAGLWSNVGSIVDADSVQSVINAWSDGAIKPVAAVAAQKFAEANPQTPLEKAAVVDAIATGISTATGAPPVK